jgi:hypothetical protein
VIGTGGDGIYGYDPDLKLLWWKGLRRIFDKVPDISFPLTSCGVSGIATCQVIFPEKNDRMVSKASQGNGSQADMTATTVDKVDHVNILNNNDNVVKIVQKLLEKAEE